jgi:hypothetical protein
MHNRKLAGDALGLNVLFVGVMAALALFGAFLVPGATWTLVFTIVTGGAFFFRKMSFHCSWGTRFQCMLALAGLCYATRDLEYGSLIMMVGSFLVSWVFWYEYIALHPASHSMQ